MKHIALVIIFIALLFSTAMPAGYEGELQPQKLEVGVFAEQWTVLGALPLFAEDTVRRKVLEQFILSQVFDTDAWLYPVGVGYSHYSWEKLSAANGLVNLGKHYGTAESRYAYAVWSVEAEDSISLNIGFGSADDAKIWHNGLLVHSSCKGRQAKKDDDIVPVSLNKGRNTFLARIDSRGGNWAFCFRLIGNTEAQAIRKKREYDNTKKYPGYLLAADVAVLHSYLSDLHPGYSRYITRNSLDKRFASLQQHLASIDSLSIPQFLAFTLPVLAQLRDGNTMLWPHEQYFQQAYKYMPFETVYRHNRLYLSQVFDSGRQNIAWSEVVSINNLPARHIILAAEALFPRDGHVETAGAQMLDDYGMLNLVCNLVLKDNERIELVYRSAAGQVDTTVLHDLSSCNAKFSAPSRAENSKPLSYIHCKELDAYIITIKTLVPAWLQRHGIDYEKMFRSVFEQAAHSKAGNLVLDLRGAKSGSAEAMLNLAQYLVDGPANYLSGVYINKGLMQEKYLGSEIAKSAAGQSGYGRFLKSKLLRKAALADSGQFYSLRPIMVQQIGKISPSRYNFRGQIYVLIDPRTKDVAAELCSILRQNSRAIFIGQETGKAQEGNCGGFFYPLRLPTSGCRIWIPAARLDIETVKQISGRGLIPDIQVPLEIADDVSQIDRHMEILRAKILSKHR
jgi:hypothetical protein